MTTRTIAGSIKVDGVVFTATRDVEVLDGPPSASPVLGRSSSSNDHGPLRTCDLVRVYRFGNEVDSQLAESGAKVLMLSDEQGVQTAAQLDTALAALFRAHPSVVVHYMPENEITAAALSTSQAALYTDKTRQMRAVTDKYPNARMSINITAYGVRQGRHLNLAGCAPYLQSVISSCYNPGRSDSPPRWDPYPDYLDPVMDVAKDWGNLPFGCGEFGNPVMPGDPSRRPSYARGAVRYLRDGCASRGIEFVGAAWWDNQKSGGPNNRLSTDNPLTAQAWKDALT